MRIRINDTWYDLDQRKLLNTEAIALQKITGKTFMQVAEAMKDGDIEALSALVWLAMKRAGSDIRYSDLEFNLADVEIDEDDKDIAEEMAVIEAEQGDPTGAADAATPSHDK
jgi:hypothetical protein